MHLSPDEFAFALFPVATFRPSGAVVSRRATFAEWTKLVLVKDGARRFLRIGTKLGVIVCCKKVIVAIGALITLLAHGQIEKCAWSWILLVEWQRRIKISAELCARRDDWTLRSNEEIFRVYPLSVIFLRSDPCWRRRPPMRITRGKFLCHEDTPNIEVGQIEVLKLSGESLVSTE